jgi:methionine sulfoxide reductase heme-binding subunit
MKTFISFLAFIPLFYISFRYSFSLGWHWPLSFAQLIKEYLHLEVGTYPKDFWKFVLHATAKTALNLFIITLAIRPLRNLVKIDFLKQRRLLGLFGFFYLVLHVMVYVGVKHHFNIYELNTDIISHQYLWFGISAFFIFLMMAVTSTKTLFKRFSSWHKLFYLGMVLVMVHYLLSKKEIFMDDMFYMLIISSLLALRLLKR